MRWPTGEGPVILRVAVAVPIGIAVAVAVGVTAGWAFAPPAGWIAAAVGFASVVAAWFAVHTVYSLRYARFYYIGETAGIEFNQQEPPAYVDFAYLGFTIGMTYQVSDTALKATRCAALRYARPSCPTFSARWCWRSPST